MSRCIHPLCTEPHFVARIAAVVSNGCAPDPRVIREARWLLDAGHDVVVHAFDRQHSLESDAEIHGVPIRRYRVGIVPYGGTWSTWRGLKKFLSTVADNLGEVDLIHCHDADTLPLMKLVSDTPVLFDMHDLHHTWIRMQSPNSFFRKFISNRLKQSMLTYAKQTQAIVTSSEGFSKWLKLHNIESTTVENRPLRQTELPMPMHPTIGYFGKVRELSSFEFLIGALQRIPESNRPHLFIAGDGTRAKDVAEMIAKTEGITAEIQHSFHHSEHPQMMEKISVMFAMYSPERGNISEGALPSKMFEAAAYGRPSIVNSGVPMGDVCESEKLGMSVEWNNVDELVLALNEIQGREVTLEIDETRERARFMSVIENLRI